MARLLITAVLLGAASSATAQSKDPIGYSGTSCVDTSCEPYMIFYYRDQHFADSRGRVGTFSTVSGRLRLDFVGLGTATLHRTVPWAGDCWSTPSPPVNPAIGSINTCLAASGYQTLSNDGASPGTCYARVLGPSDGEEGHWSAAVHATDGFIVTAISYFLWDGDPGNGLPCDASHPHRVRVYVDDDATPDADPEVVAEFDVDLGVVTPNDDTLVRLVLENPLVLEEGEYVFVAIEHAADATHAICTTACDSAFTEDTNFWSNAADVPYDWVTIESFGAAYEYNNRYYVHGFAF